MRTRNARTAFMWSVMFELDLFPMTDAIEADFDRALMRLWLEGYKVVPLDGTEDATTAAAASCVFTTGSGGTS